MQSSQQLCQPSARHDLVWATLFRASAGYLPSDLLLAGAYKQITAMTYFATTYSFLLFYLDQGLAHKRLLEPISPWLGAILLPQALSISLLKV